MAHLGPLGSNRYFRMHRRKVAPFAATGPNSIVTPSIVVPVDGAIHGVAKIGGVNASGVIVRLNYRINGILIEQAKTGVDGAYSFYGLNKADLKAYCVTFMDPSESAPYNYTVTRDHLSAG